MRYRMREIHCCDCNASLGWMSDSGPCGFMYCDSCKEAEDRAADEEEQNQE